MRKQITLLIVCPILAACGPSIDTAEWTEEVLLSDGRMAVVSRLAKARSNGFPNAPRGGDLYYEFRYPDMGIKWQSEVTPFHVRRPVAFDLIDGVPHLVLHIGDREGCRNQPPADYSAQFLKWVDNRWVEVPQAEFPVDRMLMNLYRAYWGRSIEEDAKGLVRWHTKARGDHYHPDKPDSVQSYFERRARTCGNNLRR